MSRLDALRWKVEQRVPCEREHTLHRDEATERYWVTCGDDVLDEVRFGKSAVDLSGDIRYFSRAAVTRHGASVLLADLRDLVAVAEAAQTVPVYHEVRCAAWNGWNSECDCRVADLLAALARLDAATGGETS